MVGGIYPALVTPFDGDGRISSAAFEKLIRSNLDDGVHGFFVGGTTAEFPLLSPEERKTAFEIVSEVVSGAVPLVAHVGTISTDGAVELAKHAATCGYMSVAAVPPHYYRFSVAEITDYFLDIASATDLPIVLYNIPGLTGVDLSKREYSPLHSDERVMGIKHTSWNLFDMSRLHAEFPNIAIFNGFDEVFAASMLHGASGGVGSTYNFLGRWFVAIRDAVAGGEIEIAKQRQATINQIISVLAEENIFSAVKFVLRVKGIDCGVCRRPFGRLSTEAQNKIVSILDVTGALEG